MPKKKLQGRIITPIFSVADVLRTVPWIAELASKDSKHREDCEGKTNGYKNPCKNPANWMYVYLDNTWARFCTIHIFGPDCVGGVGPRGDCAEMFRYEKWVRDNINTVIRSEA